MTAAPLDDDLVSTIRHNLKNEPSELLLEMVAPSAAERWSPEATEAARLLLKQRSQGSAEPKYRTVPIFRRAEEGQASPDYVPGDVVLAPGFTLPRGFSRLLFLGGIFGSGYRYPAWIGEIRNRGAYVYLFNGKRGWVRREDIKPMTIDVGSRFCTERGVPGTVIYWDDDKGRFYIRYDNGLGEWIPLYTVEVAP
jgi:hypothetical protein